LTFTAGEVAIDGTDDAGGSLKSEIVEIHGLWILNLGVRVLEFRVQFNILCCSLCDVSVEREP
jgi:hypothetical protein